MSDDSPYRSPVIKHDHWVTLNKKKDTLKEDFVSSGADFEENLRKAVEGLKKELDDRKACFIAAYNEIHEDNQITVEDFETIDFEDLQDLCELYHRLRSEKPILK